MFSLETRWERIADDGSWPDWKDEPNSVSGWVTADAVPTPPGADAVLVPWRPIWLGLLVNAAVFALILFLLVAAVRGIAARLRQDQIVWRRETGACEHCGYALGNLTRCPECGRDRPPSAPAAAGP